MKGDDGRECSLHTMVAESKGLFRLHVPNAGHERSPRAGPWAKETTCFISLEPHRRPLGLWPEEVNPIVRVCPFSRSGNRHRQGPLSSERSDRGGSDNLERQGLSLTPETHSSAELS